MCRWCGCPVIFGPAKRQLEKLVCQSGANTTPPACYHAHWTRKDAPLLDHLEASVDHVEAYRGGEHALANFVTPCIKCNTRKNDANAAAFSKHVPLHQVKGKYGEPQDWDGFSSVFTALVERNPETASTSDLSFGAQYLEWIPSRCPPCWACVSDCSNDEQQGTRHHI
jgi:HNH endonuclease